MVQMNGLLSLSKHINSKVESQNNLNANKKYLEEVINKIKATTTLTNKDSVLKIKSN
ncbi:MAG: hypothetical protein LBH40_03670 [Alphaproteobacteria bacterium]|jgi:hypothetical protein|nr:hypothetical protein [Alphaproteobacteria bacterium]